jgi:Holliday junction resolvase RusA-like endonuclease
MSMVIGNTVSFTVPYLCPPSVNHYKKSCYYKGKDGQAHKGMKRTPAANAFRDAVAIFAQGRTVSPETDAERRKVRYAVEITIVLGPRMRLDADNGNKVALDALESAGVIHSDAFVSTSKSNIVKNDRQNPRTIFVVTRLENECPLTK